MSRYTLTHIQNKKLFFIVLSRNADRGLKEGRDTLYVEFFYFFEFRLEVS